MDMSPSFLTWEKGGTNFLEGQKRTKDRVPCQRSKGMVRHCLPSALLNEPWQIAQVEAFQGWALKMAQMLQREDQKVAWGCLDPLWLLWFLPLIKTSAANTFTESLYVGHSPQERKRWRKKWKYVWDGLETGKEQQQWRTAQKNWKKECGFYIRIKMRLCDVYLWPSNIHKG